MNRRVLLGIAGWLAVAVAATGAGVAAIDVLEKGISSPSVRPLDDDAVHRALSRSGATSAPPAPSPSPTAASPGGVTRSLAAGGGTLTARCVNDRVTIIAATPSQGFHTGGIEHGPAASASLTFESDAAEYAVTVTCEAGSPVVHSATDDGHRGRHGGRGRG